MVLVDGSPVCIHNIRCFDREGELEVLSMARDPAMCAEISLEHCEICYGKKGVAALRKL